MSDPKRLLCIVGSMNAGGAETFLMKIYRELDKEKYQMDFAVTANGSYDNEIISYGGRIHKIRPKSMGVKNNFNDIKNIVSNNKYNYVLRVSQHSLSALELWAAKKGGAKVRVFRSSNSKTTSEKKLEVLLHKLCMVMPKIFANVRIAPSTEAAEFMFGKDCIKKVKASLLHNAIDVDAYSYTEVGRKKIRSEFSIENKYVVGHIGRLNQQKNHKFLLEVFSRLSASRGDAVLLLIGKGELEEDIKQISKHLGIYDKVIFTGVRSDIRDILSAMDIFVFPSLYEGMPNTVIEAQANGLHCIVSDTITQEAAITDLVSYKSLSLTSEDWSREILETEKTHEDQKEQFYSQKYDINSTVQEFIRIIFENKRVN